MFARLPASAGSFLTVCALTLLFVGPLWQQDGLPNSADGLLHLHRVAAVERSFEQGVLWPRWFPAVYGGLGAPTFHHYSPGFYWLAASLHWLGLHLDLAVKIVLTGMFILAGYGVYGWLKQLFGPEAGLAGAALYLAQPHFFREFYFQGDYPQLLALLILPLCLWAYNGLHSRGRLIHWLAAVASLSGLVLAHNITAMLGAGLLALYWLGMALMHRNIAGLGRCAVAALMAALFTAGFWLPALADVPFVQVENLQQDFFHYSQYFLTWAELISPQPLLDSRAANPPVPHSFGLSAWFALVAGLCSALLLPGAAGRIWGLVGGILALAFLALTTAASEPLWALIPGLNLLQFPSRLIPLATVGALLALGPWISGWPARMRWLPGLMTLTITAWAAAPFLFPGQPFLPVARLTAQDTQAYERESGIWGMTSGNEFLPRDADKEIATGLAPEPEALPVRWLSPHRAVIEPTAGASGPVLVRLHYHPGWGTDASQQETTEVTLSSGTGGWLAIRGLAQTGEPMTLTWIGTVWQRRGEMLGAAGLALAGIVLLFHGIGYGRRQGRENDAPEQDNKQENKIVRGNVALFCGAVLVLLGVRFTLGWKDSGMFPPGVFQLRSASNALAFPVQGEATAIGGENGPRLILLGWQLRSTSTPRVGETVHLRLFWQPTAETDENLHSFLHLYDPAHKRSWAIVQRQNPGGIPTSSWNPALYYVDDLRLPIPDDIPPTAYALAVGMVDEQGNRLAVAGSEDGLALLGQVSILPGRPGPWQKVRPQISTPATTHDGLVLQGYDLLPAPGGPVLRLFWETEDVPSRDWQTFVHLYNPAGERIAQYDGPALGGSPPTSGWLADALYIDRRQLLLPTGLPPGAYYFQIGLFDPATGGRLPFLPEIFATGTEENHWTNDGQLRVPLNIPAPGT